jgi:hypothetical protein
MAIWEKLFSKIIFKDYPDTSTPLNASNMNALSDAIDGIDNRVIELNSNLEQTNIDLANVIKLQSVTTSHQQYETIKASLQRIARVIKGINTNGKKIIITSITGVPYSPTQTTGFAITPLYWSSSASDDIYGMAFVLTGEQTTIYKACFKEDNAYLRLVELKDGGTTNGDNADIVFTGATGTVIINYMLI